MGIPYEESLDILKLAPRLQNALEEHGIFTIGDVLHCSLVDLPRVTRPPRPIASSRGMGSLPRSAQAPNDYPD